MHLEITCDEVEPAVGGSPCPQTCISDTSSSLSSSLIIITPSTAHDTHSKVYDLHSTARAPCPTACRQVGASSICKWMQHFEENTRGDIFFSENCFSKIFWRQSPQRAGLPSPSLQPQQQPKSGHYKFSLLGPIYPISIISIPTCKVHLDRQAF